MNGPHRGGCHGRRRAAQQGEGGHGEADDGEQAGYGPAIDARRGELITLEHMASDGAAPLEKEHST
jgi:hypothetical protein